MQLLRTYKKNRVFKRVITTVMILSFGTAGVGYAAWTDNIKTTASISTAKIDPIFCGRYNLTDVKGSSRDLKVTFTNGNKIDQDSNGYNVLQLENKLHISNADDKSLRYKGFLHYCVINKGAIPIKFNGDNGIIQGKVNGNKIDIPVILKEKTSNEPEELQADISLYDGNLKLILNQPKKILNEGESLYNENGAPQLQIEVLKEGVYSFEIELPFVMKGTTNNSLEWNNKLIIRGNNIEAVP